MKDVSLEDLKVMSLDEFVNLGLLQEINRRLLHPMGLALSVNVDEESGKVLGFGSVWDFRDDPEGMRFADYIISKDKVEQVDKMLIAKKDVREANLGYHIQPPYYVRPPKEEK